MSQNTNKRSTRRRGPGGGHGPMGGGMMSVEKAKDFKGSIQKLLSYMGRYRFAILIVCILSIISTVLGIFGPKVLGEATNILMEGLMAKIGGTGNVDFTAIGRIMLLLIGLYVFSALLSYIQGFVMSGVTNKITYRLRRDINEKMHKLPFGYYDTVTHGEILSRITNDVDTINQSLGQNLSQIISSITTIIGIPIMMLTVSWRLTLVALCVVPLSALAVMTIVKKSQKYFKSQQEYLGKVNGHVEEMLGSHVVVKAFNGEEDSVNTFDELNRTLYKSAWKSNFLSGLMMPITNFISNLAYVGVCIWGGYLAGIGKVTIGGIQSFIQYMRMFTQQIAQLAQISNVLQQTAAAAERVFEFLDQREEVSDVSDALTVQRNGSVSISNGKPIPVEGHVSFENVSFGYNPDKVIINDFSASVSPGQKIAIVGPTGAGKTTIVKLLMRFYDVNSGAILVDGHNIKLFERDSLRSLFGMVLQDTWLFNGTIADNIRYGKLDATDEEVRAAAKSAQVHHFVRTLPDGYDMVLNEEADNISQGQKQLLTIARAILANPEILILDEATSSVDTRTEILIQKAMDTLMKGRTSFVIAHRLSTIRNADLILVMKDGDIVEQGAHEELLAKNGFYANLYNSQFETAG